MVHDVYDLFLIFCCICMFMYMHMFFTSLLMCTINIYDLHFLLIFLINQVRILMTCMRTFPLKKRPIRLENSVIYPMSVWTS